MSRLDRPRSKPNRPGGGALAVVALLVLAAAVGFGVGWLALEVGGGSMTGSRPTSGSSAAQSATLATSLAPTSKTSVTVTPEPTSSPALAPSPTPTPDTNLTPTPTATPLPGMLAAVGDSYSQAFNVTASYRYKDHPQSSWVVGTDPQDGVTSLLEHFRALGGSPVVNDAATSGKKMSDAQRQAEEVVAAAANLKSGQTVYVTFELGTNDLCDYPQTSLATFTSELDTAIGTLEVGLPPGSRLLMLAVPDFRHFYDVAQADPTARAALAGSTANNCPPFLGTNGKTSMADAEAILADYDAALQSACANLNAATGSGANLLCTWNEGLLSEGDFTIGDLSTVDHFHPSLSGQAKMAATAWKADVWGSQP